MSSPANMALSLNSQMSKKMKAKVSNPEGFLINLPAYIIVEILSRVPAASVINCKLVCKKFLNLISTPEFPKLHLSRANPSLIVFQSESDGHVCRLFEFEDENNHHDVCYNSKIKFELTVFPDYFDILPALVNSITGFVCFWHHFDDLEEALYIFNPIMRQYIPVPLFERSIESPHSLVYGFGVSMISGQYKVVRVAQEWQFDEITGDFLRVTNSESRVYTLAIGSWRSIGSFPFAYDYHHSTVYCTGLLLNGNLHWLIQDLVGSDLISCFNLEEESFQPFPPPYTVEQQEHSKRSLGVLAGCLCLCDNASVSHVVIWAMKEYGMKTSWTKEFVIDKTPDSVWTRIGRPRIIKCFKDGDILLSDDYKHLYSYCPMSKTLQMKDTIVNDRIQSVLHVSTFLSLKNFALEEVEMF